MSNENELGELIKQQRNAAKATIYDLGETIGVSNTYISQIETGKKTPSKRIIFKLCYWLDPQREYDFDKKLLELYSELKDLNIEELKEEFEEYRSDFLEEISKGMNKRTESYKNNKLEVTRSNMEVKFIDKPSYDLKWLLEQEEFEVFYGRDYDIKGTAYATNENLLSKMLYSRLNKEDMKLISELIEVIISNKYRKIPKK